MKTLSVIMLLTLVFNTSNAQSLPPHELSIIHSIDDYEFPRNYIEVSEEGLPPDHFRQLVQLTNVFKFTLLQETTVKNLFEDLKNNSMARMRFPGGQCSQRRSYIQNILRKKSIVSGKILVNCPKNNGRLRLQDQVSGRYYTYTNFHDANIVAITTNAGNSFQVMDLQFSNAPLSLHDYLTEIEASQKIRPLKTRANTSSLCYWTISTQNLTF